ncbi:MAG: hypothetical protein AABW46_00545 [Nanoarchaeota archaeon]
MFVREDFRRDGLAANFLADDQLISIVSKLLEGSRINIGYPAICQREYEACSRILSNSQNDSTELCVVGHAREEHLDAMSIIIKNHKNVSANSWIPISDYFLDQTVRVNPREAYTGLKSLIQKWKDRSDKPFDIAFADCTSDESGLPERIFQWSEYCLNNGVRNIIVCDSRGIGEPAKIEEIFDSLKMFGNRIEFHPHDDNGRALENVGIALSRGVEIIGTAFYRSGERLTMIDPRELRQYGLAFNDQYYGEFERQFMQKIGHPKIVLESVLGKDKVVTGSQFRLRNRDKVLKIVFGVTSDVHIASQILGERISKEKLADIKNTFLYDEKRLCLEPPELIACYNSIQEEICPV